MENVVELVVFKVPDGTKSVLKALAAKRGYMGLSDFLRDVVRRELQSERKELNELKSVKDAAGGGASVAKASELTKPTA